MSRRRRPRWAGCRPCWTLMSWRPGCRGAWPRWRWTRRWQPGSPRARQARRTAAGRASGAASRRPARPAVGVDGKERKLAKAAGKKKVHLLGAVTHGTGLVIGQDKVAKAGKANE